LYFFEPLPSALLFDLQKTQNPQPVGRDNGAAITAVCRQFVVLCRRLNLFTRAVVAIDGSKFKAVNNRDKNYTVAKVGKRIEQVDASIARYTLQRHNLRLFEGLKTKR
jgi:hypothetical protein